MAGEFLLLLVACVLAAARPKVAADGLCCSGPMDEHCKAAARCSGKVCGLHRRAGGAECLYTLCVVVNMQGQVLGEGLPLERGDASGVGGGKQRICDTVQRQLEVAAPHEAEAVGLVAEQGGSRLCGRHERLVWWWRPCGDMRATRGA
jgi:hypothetical protein